MSTLDLRPATRATAEVVAGVADHQLAGPTPCQDYTVADLLDHIGGLAVAFTLSARKDVLEPTGPSADGSRLEPGWRDRIVAALHELGEAWTNPEAWEGRTIAGPVEMAADEAASVALNEVVVHGWDLARAAVREWSEKAVGPVTMKSPPKDGRDRLDVAFEHVRACRHALNDAQREAALYLAVPPQRAPSLVARASGRWKRSRS